MRRGFRAFTLIEALAATVILGVGIAGVLGAFSSIAKSEDRAREKEQMHRLAVEKLDELRATTDTFTTNESGDFEDRGRPEYTWSMQIDNTGIENLEAVTVVVERAAASTSSPSAEVTALVFQPPPPAEQEAP